MGLCAHIVGAYCARGRQCGPLSLATRAVDPTKRGEEKKPRGRVGFTRNRVALIRPILFSPTSIHDMTKAMQMKRRFHRQKCDHGQKFNSTEFRVLLSGDIKLRKAHHKQNLILVYHSLHYEFSEKDNETYTAR